MAEIKDATPTPKSKDLAEPALIPDTHAAAICGIGRATWHRLRAAGKVGPQPVRLGRAVRWRRLEVIAWIDAGCPDGTTWAAIRAQDLRCKKVPAR